MDAVLDRQRAKQAAELDAVRKAVDDLGWAAARLSPGADPPDVLVLHQGKRIGVEVSRSYPDRDRSGAASAESDGELKRFCRDLLAAYYDEPGRRPLWVSMDIPRVLKSPALRPVTAAERKAELQQIHQAALRRLHGLRLRDKQQVSFQVRRRSGWPAKFDVQALPTSLASEKPGVERRWQVRNLLLGWHATLSDSVLQAQVDEKSGELSRWPEGLDGRVLLLTADPTGAAGFVSPGTYPMVTAGRFDAVLFLGARPGSDPARVLAGAMP